MGALRILVGALVLTATIDATACPPDAAARAASLRSRLDREHSSAQTWRFAWGSVFAVAAGGQLALLLTETALVGEFDDATRANLTAGVAKSVLGVASRVIPPIKVPRLAVTGDACADLAAAEASLAVAAKTERKTFWSGHFGNFIVHGGGAIYIGLSVDDAWDEAAISFGVGMLIGFVATYTQPRGAWHEHRRAPEARTWYVAPLVIPDARGFSIAASF